MQRRSEIDGRLFEASTIFSPASYALHERLRSKSRHGGLNSVLAGIFRDSNLWESGSQVSAAKL